MLDPEVDALSQYLATEGELGECPQDYGLVQAAKYYNVPPWVLWEQPVFWKIRAHKFMQAEHSAQKTLDERRK